MNIPRFDRVEDFLDRATPFLTEREAQHNMILGLCNVIALGAAHYDSPIYYATVEDGDHVVGAALRTPPHQLHISQMDESALPLLAQDILDLYGAIPAAISTTGLSQRFAEQWHSLTGHSYKQRMGMRIFQLTKVRPVSGVPGSMRAARPEDRALLIDWMDAFYIETFGESRRAHVEEAVDLDLQGGPRGLVLWEDGGPVSMAGFSGPTPHGIRVLAVYTPPELRGKGYASACVAALSQHLLDEGRRFVFLFTDAANPTPNHIYQQIGYEPVFDVAEYVFESG